jgi:hypothetical protein
MASTIAPAGRITGGLTTLNGRAHKMGLGVFFGIVVAHWAEHIAQAVQIYALGWSVPAARGLLGLPFPWLVSSEWLHYGYAFFMLIGLLMLRAGFAGRSRTWWNASLGLQIWHHFEHLILLVQAIAGANLLGGPVPTSVVQLFVPRVELHLFYNAVVFLPMVVAMYLHRRPTAPERDAMRCACAHAFAGR